MIGFAAWSDAAHCAPFRGNAIRVDPGALL
jgi:hypothetical protein